VGSEITGIAKICYCVATVDRSVGVQKTRYKAIKRLEIQTSLFYFIFRMKKLEII